MINSEEIFSFLIGYYEDLDSPGKVDQMKNLQVEYWDIIYKRKLQ